VQPRVALYLGTRLHKGKQTPTQLEATRLGRPLERFLTAQSFLRGKKIATVKFVALRSGTHSVSAVHEDGCAGLFGCLRRRAQSAQSSQVALETSFCPLSLSHLDRNPIKARRDHQEDAVICAFSGLVSALLDAQGMRVA